MSLLLQVIRGCSSNPALLRYFAENAAFSTICYQMLGMIFEGEGQPKTALVQMCALPELNKLVNKTKTEALEVINLCLRQVVAQLNAQNKVWLENNNNYIVYYMLTL